ncbi:NADH dehydrogenase [ubiquinone] 1 subunit C1, mitochondrial [Latimeria chalumnae]|uniref:NADH dehydrogenase [ubiquinone] 1 subunit C1, mitochondrial n=1 Tax=Latimeria chalumnae TaxID=7897 RepID=UPI0003C19897|nr:PREDICTED: NADH dehydrogenase [ubiquinone] 1 subunit C1, mitochondrial [Latimeria chalumnae]|eukprot:XP_005996677.1 PREDICTED: NADH dehydrogenase [ubiquinone] 1 subunit C1, mitochondrial [Latimeria chalumnae]
MSFRGAFLRTAGVSKTLTRSAFTAKKADYTKPNWLWVGLTFGSTAALWILLFKQHSDDVEEYKRRNGLK